MLSLTFAVPLSILPIVSLAGRHAPLDGDLGPLGRTQPRIRKLFVPSIWP
jgi:hypothetical protein